MAEGEYNIKPLKQKRQSADKIVAHAEETDAGRVAFRDSSGFIFSKPEFKELLNVLELNRPLRYKLQQLDSDGRWRDVSKYRPVYESVLEALISLDLASAKNFSPADFSYSEEVDSQKFQYAIRRVFSQVAVAPRLSQVEAWKNYFEGIARVCTNSSVRFLTSTLKIFSTVLQYGIGGEARAEPVHSALRALEAQRKQYSNEPEKIAYSLVEGKLLSFVDRDAAAQAFHRATRLDSTGLIEHFYVDMGAYTYFGPNNLPAAPLANEIQQSIVPLKWATPANSLATVVSVDAHFFRIYAPQLYLFAQHLPDLDLVIVLCGEDSEITTALEDGERYLEHLVRLNQSGTPKNIQYLRTPVPSTVVQPKTFYACARFFAAEQLLQSYERVYVMDADLTVEDNPRTYFEGIKDITFGTATNRDTNTLSPWRRNLAGNVALQNRTALEQVLPDLLRYMAHGLEKDNSWMLDQNALAFAAERHSELYTPLDAFKRPFSQIRFRSTWEKRYFADL